MKFIKYLSLFVAAAVACVSCETGIEEEKLNPAEEYEALLLGQQSDIVINGDNIKEESVSFVFTEADFGLPVQIKYQLYFATDEAETLAAESNRTTITLDKQTLNGLIVNQLGIEPNSTAQINAYVVAYAGESELCTPKSNVISFNVTTFKAALRCYYVVGQFSGWAPETAPEIWEDTAGSNVYVGLYNFTEQADGLSGFKFLPTQSGWDGEMSYTYFTGGVDGNFSEGENSNLMLPVGIWLITADFANKTIAAKSYSQVDIMGSFDDWTNPVLMNYDPATNCWTSASTVSGGDEYKIRMNGGWDESYGGGVTVSESIPTGFVIEGGNNIVVPGSGKFYVELHADRTPWVVTYKAAE